MNKVCNEQVSITSKTKNQFSAELCLFQNAEKIRRPTGWQMMFPPLFRRRSFEKTEKKNRGPSFTDLERNDERLFDQRKDTEEEEREVFL